MKQDSLLPESPKLRLFVKDWVAQWDPLYNAWFYYHPATGRVTKTHVKQYAQEKYFVFRSQHVGQAGGAGPHDAGHPGGGGDQEPRVSSQCDQTSVRCGQGPASSEGEVAIQTVKYIPASLQSASRGIFEVI